MKFLYGDSTAFPLRENFLETLRDLTGVCVALLEADRAIEDARLRGDQVTTQAGADQSWVAALGDRALDAIRQHDQGLASLLARREADRLIAAVEHTLASANQALTHRRDSTLADIEATVTEHRRRARGALTRFLLRHALPHTVWGLSWRVEGDDAAAAVAETLAIAQCGIEAGFNIEMPQDSPWRKAVRVGDLIDDLSVQVPTPKGRLRRQKLAKTYITSVDFSPNRLTLVLSRRVRQPSKGFEIARSGEERTLTIQPVDPGEVFEPFPLEGADAEVVRHLLTEVAKGLRPLTQLRSEVTTVRLATGKDVKEDPLPPGQVARVIIDTVAPYVRQLVKRSPSKKELSLKRDIGDHKREEVFMPASEIIDQLAPLSSQQRTLFDAFGLDEGENLVLFNTGETTQPDAKIGEIAPQLVESSS